MTTPHPHPAGELLMLGVNQRSAPPRLREHLLMDAPDLPSLLADVRAAGLEQAVVLATCERLEVAAVSGEPERTEAAVRRLLAGWAGLPAEALRQACESRRGAGALRHLFAVAAALDSQVLGEPQILGQLKESHRVAAAAGMVRTPLEDMLQAAYAAAKRVRSETALAEKPVSIAAAALQVARQVQGDLGRCRGLLVGLGEMAELMAGQLAEGGLEHLTLTHPSARRAEAVARRLGCHLRYWEDLDRALADADIVVAALGEGHYTLTAALVQRALKRRRQRPMFIVDAAVPGDVEPAVEELEPAFVYGLGDLERVAERGRETREKQALAAWRIVDEQLEGFLRQRDERTAVPAVSALHRHFEALRAQVLADPRLDAETATRLLVKRLLHDPSQALRAAAAESETERAELERSLRRLFRLGAMARGSRTAPDEENET